MMDVQHSELRSLVYTWEAMVPGLKILVSLQNNELTLHLLYVPTMRRRQGYGSEVMEDLTVFADRSNLRLLCIPDDAQGTPYEALLYFYEQHGFTLAGEQMIREPRFAEAFASVETV